MKHYILDVKDERYIKYIDNGMTFVIAGFPGIGKSTCARLINDDDTLNNIIRIHDMDLNKYLWIFTKNGEKIKNPGFPKNYMTKKSLIFLI